MHEPPRDIATLADRLALHRPTSDQLLAVNQAVQQAHTQADSRLIVDMPPQSGKTTRVTLLGTLWAIAHQPDRRYGLITYSHEAARLHADRIGEATIGLPGLCPPLLAHPRLSDRHYIAGHRGTLHTGATGAQDLRWPIDTLIVDDPVAGPRTSAYADRVWDWWQTAVATRLAPHATVIVVETPYEHSLTDRLLAAEPGDWHHITVPTTSA